MLVNVVNTASILWQQVYQHLQEATDEILPQTLLPCKKKLSTAIFKHLSTDGLDRPIF